MNKKILLSPIKLFLRWYYTNKLNRISYYHFREKYMDLSFPWKEYIKEKNAYLAKWGFQVSIMESEYFSKCSGIKSDLYLPLSVWKYYIYSYLNKDSWRLAYCDKNIFSRMINFEILPRSLKLPTTRFYCMNGFFYDENHQSCEKQNCIDFLFHSDHDLIIKPTVDSHGGRGVSIIKSGNSIESIHGILKKYGSDFAIQEVIEQHSDLASFNSTSVNTIRVATYRNKQGKIRVLYGIQRFGSGDNVCDNASSGGGYCGILEDGKYNRNAHKHRQIKSFKLNDSVAASVPRYEDIKKVACALHEQFPQFSIIGWDLTVASNNQIYLIEYNFNLGYNLPQTAVGPIFTREELEEILDSVSKSEFGLLIRPKIHHPGKKGNDYVFTSNVF